MKLTLVVDFLRVFQHVVEDELDDVPGLAKPHRHSVGSEFVDRVAEQGFGHLRTGEEGKE